MSKKFALFDPGQLHLNVTDSLSVEARWGECLISTIRVKLEENSCVATADLSGFDSTVCDNSVQNEMLQILRQKLFNQGLILTA